MEEITIKRIIDHCLKHIKRFPKCGGVIMSFEHFILLDCLKNMSEEKFNELKEQYKFLMKG